MLSFNAITAIAAPLPIDNVDTDMIIPKQFLTTIKRTGLKDGLFYEMRYTVEGAKINNFILHNAPFDHAEILLSGSNFGCGSSREHAPWALLDFGIRCVIAESFADIFFNNCFKNGILNISGQGRKKDHRRSGKTNSSGRGTKYSCLFVHYRIFPQALPDEWTG